MLIKKRVVYKPDRVRERRELLNFTQQEMADALGMKDKSVYSKYETGKSKWRAEHLALLAEVLHVQVGYFFD